MTRIAYGDSTPVRYQNVGVLFDETVPGIDEVAARDHDHGFAERVRESRAALGVDAWRKRDVALGAGFWRCHEQRRERRANACRTEVRVRLHVPQFYSRRA